MIRCDRIQRRAIWRGRRRLKLGILTDSSISKINYTREQISCIDCLCDNREDSAIVAEFLILLVSRPPRSRMNSLLGWGFFFVCIYDLTFPSCLGTRRRVGNDDAGDTDRGSKAALRNAYINTLMLIAHSFREYDIDAMNRRISRDAQMGTAPSSFLIG